MQKSHNWRLAARGIGASLVSVETILNATSTAASGAIAVLATVVITVAGAATIPIASRAWKAGEKFTAVALVAFFFPLVLAVSFTAGLERAGGKIDQSTAAHQASETQGRIASSAYDTAKAAQDRDCGKTQAERDAKENSTACKRSQKAFLKVTEGYQNAVADTAQNIEDAAAKRVAAFLAFAGVSEESIRLYMPSLWPMALLLGGFLFVAVGWGHEDIPTPVADPEPVVIPPPPAGRLGKQGAIQVISDLIDATPDKKLRIKSTRALALQINAAPASLALWMNEWKTTGTLNVVQGDRETIITKKVVLVASK